MQYIDSHCHIHDKNFFAADDAQAAYQRAIDAGLGMICIGTDQADSRAVVEFTSQRDYAWGVVGVHPHDTKDGVSAIEEILKEKHASIVGIGEIGLDYFYTHSPRDTQIAALEQQLQWASEYDLPVSFHVREAFDDFWPILDNFSGIRGVLHSFTDTMEHAERAITRGLYIGVNGISTFTKSAEQQVMFSQLPLEKILLETDAPFLTPAPLRGKINEPSYVVKVAEHLSVVHSVTIEEIAVVTTNNARQLFVI